MAVNTASGFSPDQKNIVYVGPGVTLTGEISISGVLVVDGLVEGEVTAPAISVGPSGVVRGKIAAIEADISGSVADHIEIEQLLLVRSTGRLEGHAIFGEIELEKGAVVSGDLSTSGKSHTVAGPKTKPSRQPVLRVTMPAPADSVDDEEEEEFVAPVVAESPATSAMSRLNEAVHAAKSSGVGKIPTSGGEAVKRAVVLRSPLRKPRRLV